MQYSIGAAKQMEKNTKQNWEGILPYLLFRFRGGFSTVPVSLQTKQIRW